MPAFVDQASTVTANNPFETKMSHRYPSYDTPLPLCEGPKLQPYHNAMAVVKFRRLLSTSDTEATSYVFEVSIDSELFALKMVSYSVTSPCSGAVYSQVPRAQFKFYDESEGRAALSKAESRMVPRDILVAHDDPFYNECRAYGRLEQANLNGKVAARCYGYIAIPAEREDYLDTKFNVGVWNRPEGEYAKPAKQRQPFRGILKELLHGDRRITHRVAKKMLSDLQSIRVLGIFPLDITAENYKAGLLIDMSIAVTKPNFIFDIRPKWQVQQMRTADLRAFDSMMEELGVKTWVRALPKKETVDKLRPRVKRARYV